MVVARTVRGSKAHNEGPQTRILGAIIMNLVATAICRQEIFTLGFND